MNDHFITGAMRNGLRIPVPTEETITTARVAEAVAHSQDILDYLDTGLHLPRVNGKRVRDATLEDFEADDAAEEAAMGWLDNMVNMTPEEIRMKRAELQVYQDRKQQDDPQFRMQQAEARWTEEDRKKRIAAAVAKHEAMMVDHMSNRRFV